MAYGGGSGWGETLSRTDLPIRKSEEPDIIKSGFFISDFIEPKPVKAAIKVRPNFYEIHSKIPLFMIFELKKK